MTETPHPDYRAQEKVCSAFVKGDLTLDQAINKLRELGIKESEAEDMLWQAEQEFQS